MDTHVPEMLRQDLRPDPVLPHFPAGAGVILIGMAGAGKSTVGKALAQRLNWACADTDHIIEAHYGVVLQRIADTLSKDEFLDLECRVVLELRLSRTVLATGGSVVYRERAMRHLSSLGPLVYLDVSLPVILERIARKPDRGLAIAPGQTVEDLFLEREELYRRYADISLPVHDLGKYAEAQRHFRLFVFSDGAAWFCGRAGARSHSWASRHPADTARDAPQIAGRTGTDCRRLLRPRS